MEKFPLEIASSTERIPRKTEQIREIVGAIGKLEDKVAEIIERDERLGEGNAAIIYDLEFDVQDPVCDAAAKFWRNKPRRELTPFEYARIQWLTPHEEFLLQNELYEKGVRVPRPITFGKIGDRDVMTMEKIKGHTLRDIYDAGGTVETPWKELEALLVSLRNAGVVHRDLHAGNVMLRTDQPIDSDEPLKGEFVLIDFGLSKKFMGSSPEPEDFRVTIGNESIMLPNDGSMLEKLKPRQSGSPLLKLK